MRIITIKPADGRLVRDPATGREVTKGTRVDGDDGFWVLRLDDKDVTEMSADEIIEHEAAQRTAQQAAVAATDKPTSSIEESK